MAKAKPSSFLQGISGQLSAKENTIFRIRNGKTEIYSMDRDNRHPMTVPQARTAAAFRQKSRLASLINRDPLLSAPFLAAYKALSPQQSCTTLYHYILSRLLSDSDTFSRYEYLLTS